MEEARTKTLLNVGNGECARNRPAAPPPSPAISPSLPTSSRVHHSTPLPRSQPPCLLPPLPRFPPLPRSLDLTTLSSPTFSPLDYFNSTFRTEAALKDLPAFGERVREKAGELDGVISRSIQEQATTGESSGERCTAGVFVLVNLPAARIGEGGGKQGGRKRGASVSSVSVCMRTCQLVKARNKVAIAVRPKPQLGASTCRAAAKPNCRETHLCFFVLSSCSNPPCHPPGVAFASRAAFGSRL